MSKKAKIAALMLALALMALPLACKAKPGTAGQSARANLTPEQLKQVDLIEIPNQNSPVDISPEQLARMKLMKFLGSNTSITIFPVRINGNAQDAASAGDLASKINDAGLCKAEPAKQSLLLRASLDDPNEINKLLNMAREFRDYAKENPPDTDYALYPDYMFTPNWEFAMVHFVVCDRQGEWVIVDLQNSHHPDYQSINPKSREDCNRLVVKRLESWLRDQATAAPTAAAAAGSPMDPTEAQKVLDRFLGNWSWEVTTYGPESSPEEKHSTGRSSYARVLGGNFVEEMGEDSEEGSSLVLYTYDQRQKCYLLWVFLSKYGGPDTPFKGKWDEATRTIDWAVTNAEGQFVTVQHHFVSDDAFESNIVARDSAGHVLWRQEFKFTRDRNPQKASQSGVVGGAPILVQTPEQKVLDRFLGNWSWEVTSYGPGSRPEEQHATGRSSYARVLGGSFVEEMGEDSEEGFSLVLYTYDRRQDCYLLWVFLSKYGGPDSPFKGKWDEAARTIEWAVTNADGQSVTTQHHFVSDDAFESSIAARDGAGQVLWRQEFKFTRDGNPQKVSQSGVAGGAEAYKDNAVLQMEMGRLDVVKELVEQGADVNQQTAYESVLDVAVEGGHYEIVRLLVTHGAKIQHSFLGRSQIRRARYLKHDEIADFLQEALAKQSQAILVL